LLQVLGEVIPVTKAKVEVWEMGRIIASQAGSTGCPAWIARISNLMAVAFL
jgi:hypothetical protein